MIPIRYINEWRQTMPWQETSMIEQDLIIHRALIEIFSHEKLASTLAFRGGTALHKLFFSPPRRYSEDIDLVQIKPEPIGEAFDNLRSVLDPWLGKPQRKTKEGRANLYYRYQPEGSAPVKMRLKIEINTREHFSILPYQKIPFSLQNSWYSGATNITCFQFNELIGTKLRALYQRKKGRDLFDLWLATQSLLFDTRTTLRCFNKYMSFENRTISRAMLEENLFLKMQDPIFLTDIQPLLGADTLWDANTAYHAVHKQLVCKLPGEVWAGAC